MNLFNYTVTMTTAQFHTILYNWFQAHERQDLPWRPPLLTPDKDNVLNPYYVLVSEVMLQQTQATRVKSKFSEFITTFPTIESLASAATKDVLHRWQGLGYNRRGLWLRDAAKAIIEKHQGTAPDNRNELQQLKGIGPYTAGAIAAFAFNQPTIFIETNIRAVYIHHFFSDTKQVSDQAILKKVTETLDTNQPRTFYYALMDYGSYLKTQGIKPTRSQSYKAQSRFQGSTRAVRADIIRLLLEKPRTQSEITSAITTVHDVPLILLSLKRDGLIMKHYNHWQITS